MPYSWTTPDTAFATGDVLAASDVNTLNTNIGYLGNVVEPSLTNKSGGSLGAGAVVIRDSSNDSAFTTTTTADLMHVLGIVMETIANNAAGRVATAGVVTVNVQGNVTRGNYLATSTTAGRAKDAGAIPRGGVFAVALSAYAGGGAGTVTAKLLPAAHAHRVEVKSISVNCDGSGNGSASANWDTAFNTISMVVACIGGDTQGAVSINSSSITGVTVGVHGGPASDSTSVNVIAVGY